MATQPLTSFQPFPRLPFELQWQIYSYVFPRRIVAIFTDEEHPARLLARLSPTTLSAVSQDARYYLPHGYKMKLHTAFATSQDAAITNTSSSSMSASSNRHLPPASATFTKISPAVDVLFLRRHPNTTLRATLRTLITTLHPSTLANINSLAMYYDDFHTSLREVADLECFCSLITQFPALTDLNLVLRHTTQFIGRYGLPLSPANVHLRLLTFTDSERYGFAPRVLKMVGEKFPHWKVPRVRVFKDGKELPDMVMQCPVLTLYYSIHAMPLSLMTAERD